MYICVDLGDTRYLCPFTHPPNEPTCDSCPWMKGYQRNLDYYKPIYTAWKGICISYL